MPHRSAHTSALHAGQPGSSGWLLVGLIVLISAVLVGLVGITFYLTEHLRNTSLRQNQTKAIYLAQAGVMRELYDFRNGSEISLGEVTVTAGPPDDVYNIAGPNADFLLVNLRTTINFPTDNLCPATGPGRQPRDHMTGWFLRNVLASGSSSITIDQIRVNWDAGNEGILSIDINNNTVYTAACNTPGVKNTFLDITNQTLAADARWANNHIWFTSTAMESKNWIEITFRMTDGSERVSHWDRLSNPDRSADFTLRSVGEVRRGAFPFVLWRRLKAEYRICRSVVDANCNSRVEEEQEEGKLIGYGELTMLSP